MKNINLFTVLYLLVMFTCCYGEQDRPRLLGVGDDWSERQIVEYQSKDGLKWNETGWFQPDCFVHRNDGTTATLS